MMGTASDQSIRTLIASQIQVNKRDSSLMKSLSETIYTRKDFLIVLGPPRGGGLTFQSFDEIRRNRSNQS